MLELCSRCGKLHYRTDACATKSRHAGRTARQQTEGALKSDVENGAIAQTIGERSLAGPQAQPVDIKILSGIITEAERKLKSEMINPKRGRPRIHLDRKAYKAQKERERRAKAKA